MHSLCSFPPPRWPGGPACVATCANCVADRRRRSARCAGGGTRRDRRGWQRSPRCGCSPAVLAAAVARRRGARGHVCEPLPRPDAQFGALHWLRRDAPGRIWQRWSPRGTATTAADAAVAPHETVREGDARIRESHACCSDGGAIESACILTRIIAGRIAESHWEAKSSNARLRYFRRDKSECARSVIDNRGQKGRDELSTTLV